MLASLPGKAEFARASQPFTTEKTMQIDKTKLSEMVRKGQVKLSFHASERLRQRGIGKDAAISAILNGKIEFSSQGRDAKYCAKQGKLRIIFAMTPHDVEIVSTFWV